MSALTVRALAADETRAFRTARLLSAEWQPYLMHALFAVSPLASPGLGTFAVDARWRLYLDPERLTGSEAWTVQEQAGVLLHEVGHLLREHAPRAHALPGPVHALAWNLAGDAEINDDLLAAGVPLPEGVVTPNDLGCEPGGLAEDYYAAIVPPTPEQNEDDLPDDGEAGCGSGAGCPAVPGEVAADVAVPGEVSGPMSEADGDLVRRRVATDVQSHEQAKGRGSVPAGMARWADKTLSPPTVPWARLLRSSVRRAVADCAGRVRHTYTRPSRRRLPKIITPAMRAPAVTVSIVIDTSGSMSQEDLTAAMGEVQGVLTASGVARDRVTLLACDAAATTPRRVRSLSDVDLTGGGGTDMRIGITAAESARPAPHVVVVLTDGDTPWPSEPTRARLVCAVIRDSEPRNTPAWATTVHVPPAAKGAA